MSHKLFRVWRIILAKWNWQKLPLIFINFILYVIEPEKLLSIKIFIQDSFYQYRLYFVLIGITFDFCVNISHWYSPRVIYWIYGMALRWQAQQWDFICFKRWFLWLNVDWDIMLLKKYYSNKKKDVSCNKFWKIILWYILELFFFFKIVLGLSHTTCKTTQT